MSAQTNDPNPKGTEWFNKAIYGSDKTIYPEEDYQIKALPKSILHRELGRRLNLFDVKTTWRGKHFDCSAITDGTLLHHLSNRLAEEPH